MLVLSRKKDQSIGIRLTPELLRQLADAGEEVRIGIMCIEIRSDKVRLGVEAPRGIPIHRNEIWERLNAEPVEAA